MLNFILQTHETKVQQEEFIAFADSMSPSKNTLLNGLIFKKVIEAATIMQQLRIFMRAEFRKKLEKLEIKNLMDPNVAKPDLNKGDKEFRKLIKKIVKNLTVEHVQPEEVVIC